MTTPTPRVEHWCRLERAPSGPSLSRSVCTCGWAGEWLLSETRATEAGRDHTAAAKRDDAS
jgi:hypothetical protein